MVLPSPGTSLDPLRRGIPSVSTLGPISVAFLIPSFHRAHDLGQSLRDHHGESWDTDPPLDALGWEARHASIGAARAHEEREID
jgi:hypothetical protein